MVSVVPVASWQVIPCGTSPRELVPCSVNAWPGTITIIIRTILTCSVVLTSAGHCMWDGSTHQAGLVWGASWCWWVSPSAQGAKAAGTERLCLTCLFMRSVPKPSPRHEESNTACFQSLTVVIQFCLISHWYHLHHSLWTVLHLTVKVFYQ